MATTTRTKKRKLKKKRIIIAMVVLVAIIAAASFGVYKLCFNKKEVKTVATVTDEIANGYNYTITDEATKYSKQLFDDLKKELSKDSVNEEKYAKLEAQLFVSEFFTLSNKVNRNDVGGVQFIYPDYQESFQKEAMDENGLYHYLENDIYGNRDQKLPEVTEVTVDNIENIEYTIGTDFTDDSAYQVEVSIKYKEDMDYPTKATLTFVHEDNKLSLVEVE